MRISSLGLLSKKIIVVLVSTLSFSAFANDLYVSTTGNDSNAGTSASPFKTIQRGVSLATSGTTVHVAPGNYSGNVTSSASGTATARIRYVSDAKHGAKIVGTGTEFHWDNRGSYVDIVGFDISGSGRGGILNTGSYTLIANNHVHDLKVSGGCTGNGGAGIVNANYLATDCDIIGNVVHDVGVPGSCNGVQGIYHSVLRGCIANNISYRNASFGIHLWHAANESSIVNNTVFNNGSSSMGGGIVVGRGDTGAGVMNNTHILNNIVYNNPGASIIQYCYSGFNCIGTGNTVSDNLVFGNGNDISLKVGSAVRTIAADPQFVNYQANGSGDYHLKNTSPAINAGTSLEAPATDIDGNSRDSAIDIGAYEYVGSVVIPAPAISLSTQSLSLGSVIVGSSSAASLVTIKNTGNADLLFPGPPTFTGPFTYANTGTCGNSLAAGSTCTASVKYTATAVGNQLGTMTIPSNAADSPSVVQLSGTGVAVTTAPIASLSTNLLSFGWVKVGASSVVKYVTITNKGNATLTFNNSSVSGDFTYGNLGNCESTLAVGASCTYSIKFVPKLKGSRTGQLLLYTNASATPSSISLTGRGY